MRGFVKGALTGAAVFGAGIAGLALVLPAPAVNVPAVDAPADPAGAAPDVVPAPPARTAPVPAGTPVVVTEARPGPAAGREPLLLSVTEAESEAEPDQIAQAGGGNTDRILGDGNAAEAPPLPEAGQPAPDEEAPRLGPAGVGNTPPPRPLDAVEPAADTVGEPPVVGTDAAATEPVAESGAEAGAATAEPAAEPAVETTPEPDPAPEPAAEAPAAAATPVAAAEPASPRASVLEPARQGRLTPGTAVEGVRINRLPQVAGADGGMPDPVAAPAREPAPADALPAWQAHAATVELDGRPPLGLVLLDLPPDPADLPVAPIRAQIRAAAEAAILELPMPVTVALDPFDPDATRRAGVYRAAGHEVVLTLDGVSALATPADLEVLFGAWAEAIPAAIGVVDPPSAGARRGRTLAASLIPVLRDRGMGLVAPESGLSPLLNAARGGGVARAGLYRSLDAADESPETLRRQLDRAAFEAERLGRVAVIGRADRAGTLAAILDWRAGDGARADRVQMVPVGAVLTGP